MVKAQAGNTLHKQISFISAGHKSESFGKRELQLQKCCGQIGLWICGSVSSDSSSLIIMWKGPAYCGCYQTWRGGRGVIWKAGWESLKSKSVSDVPPWPMSRLLPWFSSALEFSMRVMRLFLPQLLWSWRLITAIEILTKLLNYLKYLHGIIFFSQRQIHNKNLKSWNFTPSYWIYYCGSSSAPDIVISTMDSAVRHSGCGLC